MLAEYHSHFGSAALMLVNEMHDKLAKKNSESIRVACVGCHAIK